MSWLCRKPASVTCWHGNSLLSYSFSPREMELMSIFTEKRDILISFQYIQNYFYWKTNISKCRRNYVLEVRDEWILALPFQIELGKFFNTRTSTFSPVKGSIKWLFQRSVVWIKNLAYETYIAQLNFAYSLYPSLEGNKVTLKVIYLLYQSFQKPKHKEFNPQRVLRWFLGQQHPHTWDLVRSANSQAPPQT